MSEPSVKWKLNRINEMTKEIQNLLYDGHFTVSKREIITSNCDEILTKIASVQEDLNRIGYKLTSE